jgi:hypothetical protein
MVSLRKVDFYGVRECKRRHPLNPGQSSKQYLEVFGLKAYRDLQLQGGEALLLC